MKPLAPRIRLPRARRRPLAPISWLWSAWLLPTNIVGHLAGRLVGRRSVEHPRRIQGPAASASLYEIRPGLGLDWVGAVTLGHVILHRRRFFTGQHGKLILAHELAHTRQHDILGPLYLPLHILAQSISAVLSLGRPARHSRVHDYNPLEQTFICLGASGYGRLAQGNSVLCSDGTRVDARTMLSAFGLA
jgi:hypothetical protein